jgi:hypothetical protein
MANFDCLDLGGHFRRLFATFMLSAADRAQLLEQALNADIAASKVVLSRLGTRRVALESTIALARASKNRAVFEETAHALADITLKLEGARAEMREQQKSLDDFHMASAAERRAHTLSGVVQHYHSIVGPSPEHFAMRAQAARQNLTLLKDTVQDMSAVITAPESMRVESEVARIMATYNDDTTQQTIVAAPDIQPRGRVASAYAQFAQVSPV